MPTLNHVHKMIYYKEKPVAGISTVLYRCMDPVCTYKVDVEFLVGKLNQCQCGVEFVLSKDDLRRKQPKCKECSNTKEAVQYRRIKAVMDQLVAEKRNENTEPFDDLMVGELE